MTVLERLRELPCDNAECKGICQLCGVCPCDKFALRNLPTLLALAEAVDKHREVVKRGAQADHYLIVKTRQEVFAALADLEKEAT